MTQQYKCRGEKLKLTLLQKDVLESIKDNEYCDIEDIMDDLDKPKNIISRILRVLEWDLDLIQRRMNPVTYGTVSNGASKGVDGWVLTDEGLHFFQKVDNK